MILFYTILSFFQCWPRIFLVQYRGKLCGFGVMFAPNCYQKIKLSKVKIAEKNDETLLRQYCTGLFPIQCCVESLGQHCTGLLPMQICPKSVTTTLNRIFHVQYCLEPLGQLYARFFQLPVQCCPKRIRTTLKIIFS